MTVAQKLIVDNQEIIVMRNIVMPYSKAVKITPKDYVQLSLGVAVRKYVHEAHFREELHNGLVWVEQEEVKTSGYKEILDDYSFAKVSKGRFSKLHPTRKAFHDNVDCPKGSGFITIDNRFLRGCLRITSWADPSIEARAIYVRRDVAEQVMSSHALAPLKRA